MAKQSTQRANLSEVARLLQEVLSTDGDSLEKYQEDGWFTNEEYRESIGLSECSSRRQLKKLVESQKLEVKRIVIRNENNKSIAIYIYKINK